MTPKPLPRIFTQPKLNRLPERKAVTIGIGFHCRDGVVIAADQQQTSEGFFKTHSTKLGNIIYGGATILWTYSHLSSLASVMKDGVFAKLHPFPPAYTMDEIQQSISTQIKEMKSEYPEEMQMQQFLYSYSCGAGVRFMRYSAGIIDEPEWAPIGIGDSSLVNYIYETFSVGSPMFMNVDYALDLAVYMVYLAKKFVDKVGGQTDAVILRSNGAPEFVTSQRINLIEQKCERVQHAFLDLFKNEPHSIPRATMLEVTPLSPSDVQKLKGLK
jgi:20S proteasome alpha/beta subunit